ncbi:cache domain-containing sensor histidine kinase [Cohnella fermenti]|uniref:histidine kinase n=1 Tax=Cohnella fermenti TaxID=2565925 RepID=A0A4S4BMM5_9BACL|nr:sensor histidine kinase [Cohnella fermenti]THF76086.1 sensor histidine kinase [Cohnella fermenti]
MTIGLKWKLNLAYTVLIILLISLSSYFNYRYYIMDIRKNMDATTGTITQQIEYNLDQYLDTLVSLSMRPLIHEDGIKSGMEDLLTRTPAAELNFTELQVLEDEVNNFFLYPHADEVTAVHLIDNSGSELRYFPIMQREYDLAPADSPYYNAAKAANGKFVITETLAVPLLYNRDVVNNVFSIYRQLNVYETDKPFAMLVLDFKLDKLANFVNNEVLGADSVVRIVSANNQIVYSTRPEEISTAYSPPDANRWFLGESRLQKADWRVVVGVPIGSVTHRTDLLLVSCYIVGVAILFAMVISGWFATAITRPLHRLQRLMKNAENGEFNVQFHTKSKDEIYHLGNSFNHMIAKIKHLINKVYLTEIYQKEAEFAALQSQISPHFLFNTLESIRMMAEIDGSARSVQMITSLGRLLKENMQQKKWIACREEVEYIENYLLLQSMRLSYPLSYTIECDPELNDRPILAFLIQPLVENSVLHGIRPLLRPGDIRIQLKKEGASHMRIRVADNGAGIPPDELERLRTRLYRMDSSGASGIGLVNINLRMRHAFGQGYALQVSSTPNQGTTVEWTVPLTFDSTSKGELANGTI